MPSPIEVIDKLQQMLNLRFEMEQEKDELVDVPYVDDDEYRTHRPFGEMEDLKEQEEDEEEEEVEPPAPLEDEPPEGGGEEGETPPPEPLETDPEPVPGEEAAPEAPEAAAAGEGEPAAPPPGEAGGETPPAEEPGGVDTAGAADVGAEAGAEAGGAPGEEGGDEFGAGGDEFGADAGMPGAPEPLTPKQIGKVYELKKIYSRLSALEKFLADTPDKEMVELRNKISDATDLFKTLSANFQQYKDQLDDIIVTYYKFLDAAFTALRKYYKQNRGKEL